MVLFNDHQLAHRDAAHFYYPLYQFAGEQIAAGRFPLWNPELWSGMPFAGLCDAMIASWGEAEGIARAGNLLGLWIADGLVVGVAEVRAD